MAVLDGIRVVVTGSAAALDMASLLLSDNGAEAIRVQPPGGDARRGLPAWRLWNRGARSIVLDAAVAADRDTADTLIDTADVLLEAQGGAAGLGWSFGYQALSPRGNAGLVHCTVTAFGRSGELSWLPPYDGVVEARSGAKTSISAPRSPARRPPTGPARTPAMRPPTSPCSPSPRRCWCASATGAASTSTPACTRGCSPTISPARCAGRTSSASLTPPLPAMAGAAGPFLPYLVCRCKDGQWMQITNNTARLFRHWMEVIGLGHHLGRCRALRAPRRPSPTWSAKVELAHLILDAMAARTFDEWLEPLPAGGADRRPFPHHPAGPGSSAGHS